MGPLSWQELAFIFLLALLIFGPKKLPELGKTIGKAMTEFRRASSELKSTFDREMSTLERETELKEVTASINSSVGDSYNYDSYNYDSSSYDSGGYNYDSPESTASQPSTASASAPQGAQSTEPASTPVAATQPEGAVANGSLTNGGGTQAAAPPSPEQADPKVVAS